MGKHAAFEFVGAPENQGMYCIILTKDLTPGWELEHIQSGEQWADWLAQAKKDLNPSAEALSMLECIADGMHNGMRSFSGHTNIIHIDGVQFRFLPHTVLTHGSFDN